MMNTIDLTNPNDPYLDDRPEPDYPDGVDDDLYEVTGCDSWYDDGYELDDLG